MTKGMERLKSLKCTTRNLIIGVIIIVAIVLVLLVIFSGSGKTTISVETALKEIILASDLNTAEYTYKSIVEVKEGDVTKYYVAYKGTVHAGVDFEKVKIERSGDIIRIVLPEINIQQVNVDPEMDYIFVKKKYDTETTYAEAYSACSKDLDEEARSNQTLLDTAREGAKATVMALVKPFESQLNEGETFEIVFEQAMEGGAQ